MGEQFKIIEYPSNKIIHKRLYSTKIPSLVNKPSVDTTKQAEILLDP
jgi:hypothetical protein